MVSRRSSRVLIERSQRKLSRRSSFLSAVQVMKYMIQFLAGFLLKKSKLKYSLGQQLGSFYGCLDSDMTSSTQSRSCQDPCRMPRNPSRRASSIFSGMPIRPKISSSSWVLRFQLPILTDSLRSRMSATQIQMGQDVRSQEDLPVAH